MTDYRLKARTPKAALCRGCNAPIYWVTTTQGLKMPINTVPDPNGLFVLEWDGEEPYAINFERRSTPENVERFTSHFATCPKAKEFRGTGGH